MCKTAGWGTSAGAGGARAGPGGTRAPGDPEMPEISEMSGRPAVRLWNIDVELLLIGIHALDFYYEKGK